MKAKTLWIFKLFKALAIVGVAIGSFGFVAIQVVSDVPRDSISNVKTGIRSINAKASSYYLDTGHFPASIDDLLINGRKLTGWNGPYIIEQQSKDTWGRRYILRSPGLHGEIDVISLGADGLVGGVDANADIGNWESK
jgi:general secretion pathway protein G